MPLHPRPHQPQSGCGFHLVSRAQSSRLGPPAASQGSPRDCSDFPVPPPTTGGPAREGAGCLQGGSGRLQASPRGWHLLSSTQRPARPPRLGPLVGDRSGRSTLCLALTSDSHRPGPPPCQGSFPLLSSLSHFSVAPSCIPGDCPSVLKPSSPSVLKASKPRVRTTSLVLLDSPHPQIYNEPPCPHATHELQHYDAESASGWA